MIRSLVAIYHSRVDYPGYVPPTSGQFKLSSDGEVSTVAEDRSYKYANPADIPVSPGGEIEDEAIDRSHDGPRRRECREMNPALDIARNTLGLGNSDVKTI